MKILMLLPIATASLLLAQDPAAPQQTPPGAGQQRGRAHFGGRPARESRAEQVSKVLNLSAAQQQKAHELFQDEAVISQGYGPKMQAQHAAMRDAIKRGATPEEIDRIAQEGATTQAQMTAAHAKTMAKLYSTLSAEQKKTFDEHPDLLMGGGGPRPGRGPGGPDAQRFKGRPARQ